MAAVRKGVGREAAHEVIKEHAVATALSLREGGENNLIQRLASDERLKLSLDEINSLMAQPLEFTGAARLQVAVIVDQIDAVASLYPEAATYSPGSIL